MLRAYKRVWCPLAELNLAMWKRKELVGFCMSIAGRCKVCPHAIITTGFRLVKKSKVVTYTDRKDCPAC